MKWLVCVLRQRKDSLLLPDPPDDDPGEDDVVEEPPPDLAERLLRLVGGRLHQLPGGRHALLVLPLDGVERERRRAEAVLRQLEFARKVVVPVRRVVELLKI